MFVCLCCFGLGGSMAALKGDGTKVTDPNLRFPAGFCKSLWFVCFPSEAVNLRQSAVLRDRKTHKLVQR